MEKKNIDWGNIGFGYIPTDYRYVSNYKDGKWDDGQLTQDPNIVLNECAGVLQYAQTVFEGLKAYKGDDGANYLFRPDMNAKRTNDTNDRLCIPRVPEEDYVQAVKAIVSVDQDWIPTAPGTSLYIRPFIIAVDPHVGVHPAHHLLFIIILSPVGAYYPEGINPVKIYVERQYVRAVKGGMGFTKTAGNYAASLKAQAVAEEQGYTQVLWLDGVERKYIEEVGTMNVFFKINGEIITPALEGSILGGITRMSCIELLRSWGYTVTERRLALAEVCEAAATGALEEAFGTGTAAVISPIGELKVDDEKIHINHGQIGAVAQRLYDTLTGIQNGRVPDPFGWVVPIA